MCRITAKKSKDLNLTALRMQHPCLHEARTSLTLSCVFKTGVCRQAKVKVKFTLEQATKAQRGRSCTAVLFL
jgi:hypothetical protein